MRPLIGVILFPGTNCELEVLRACERAGMKAEIFRWNDSRNKLKKYDGYIIPGGFSYEDRGRSGIIASKDPIMDSIKKESENGKVVFGICNGAQILVEAGLIPGLEVNRLTMGLNWNERIHKGKILGVGFYNDWIYMRSDAKKGRSAFNNFGKDYVMKIPVAHAEGRFTIREEKILQALIKNEQTVFRYCNEKGDIIEGFPVNPNGAVYNLAGVCNPQGNVMSLMPHPERTEVSGQPVFDSISAYLTGKHKLPSMEIAPVSVQKTQEDTVQTQKIAPDIEIRVELIITDNEERTIERTMKNRGYKNLKLKRKIYFGIHCVNKKGLLKTAEKLIESGEIANLNKEIPHVRIAGKEYLYDKAAGGLIEKSEKPVVSTFEYFVRDLDNFAGKTVMSKLETHSSARELNRIEKGVMWTIGLKKKESVDKLIRTHIFHNPNAAKLIALN